MMPEEKWKDVTGDVNIGGDWWSKNWRSKPHVVPSPGGPKNQPARPVLTNGEAHTIPEPKGTFLITCGQCDACMTFAFDLCQKAKWV